MPQPTAEQRTIIESVDGPLVVQAGAGSGKTWVLVQRFMHLLRQHPEWQLDGIVAITFTEKAAREMRHRIRKAVSQEADARRDDPLWQARKRHLDRLRVSTVHSLCARVLRENAIAAAIDPLFTVLDEQEAGLLKEEALEAALATLAAGSDPALKLLATLSTRDVRAQLEALLNRRGSVRMAFAELPPPEALLKQWSEWLERSRREEWARVRQSPEVQVALDELPRIAIVDTGDKFAGAVRRAQEGCAAAAGGDLPAAIRLWGELSLQGGTAAAWGGKECLAGLKDSCKTLRKAARELEKQGCAAEIGEDDSRAAEALHMWRALWDTLEAAYARLKAARQALDFDDLELHVRDLVRDPGRYDERLRSFLRGINHLMVDEYQDINPIQQEIIQALAPGRGQLFVVGDAKQSIYRFRQAQVRLFNQIAARLLNETGRPPLRLSQSFRTHASLVAAANAAFEAVLSPWDGQRHAEYEAAPAALTSERAAPQPGPLAPTPVELICTPENDEAGEGLSAEDGRLWEADAIAARLLELKERGFCVWDRNMLDGKGGYRPFRFDDAAVLLRAMTPVALYEERFKQAGLPYLTASGRGYYDRPEVQDLLAVLAWLHNPADDLSLAAALRSPLFGLSDETLYRLRWRSADGAEWGREPRSLSAALVEPPPTQQDTELRAAAHTLTTLAAAAGRAPVWQLLRTLLDQTGYEVALALNDRVRLGGGRQLNNVQKLLAVARLQGGASLVDFLRRVDNLRAREVREGEALGFAPEEGAVQIMSVHAAKGLEFPVVVVADAGRTLRAGDAAHLLHDPFFGLVCKLRDRSGDPLEPTSYLIARRLVERMEEAEDRRLLYVAFTRAADLLIVAGHPRSETGWMRRLCDAWELDLSSIPLSEDRPDALIRRDGFDVRVCLSPSPADRGAPAPAQPVHGAALPALPALAQPWSAKAEEESAPEGPERPESGEAASPDSPLRPLVRRHSAGAERAAAGVVAALLRRALCDDGAFTAPPVQMRKHLALHAARGGIHSADAIERAAAALGALRRRPFFTLLAAAQVRYCDIPYTVETPAGIRAGRIDLLARDRVGRWHLVHWVTEWVSSGGEAAVLERCRRLLAPAALAAGEVTGAPPRVVVCFLTLPVREYELVLEEALT